MLKNELLRRMREIKILKKKIQFNKMVEEGRKFSRQVVSYGFYSFLLGD